MSIYAVALRSLLKAKALGAKDSILVTCGGPYDEQMLGRFGLSGLITNLDEGTRCQRWQRADAESLPFPDSSFDWGIVYSGLHHLRSPHRGACELMRVARNVLVLESRDSLAMRCALALRITGEFEHDALIGATGGLRNGPIPNFVYRWSEREVRKMVESARPDRVNAIRYFHGLRLPRSLGRVPALVARAIVAVAPGQGNEFGFAVLDTGQAKPWIVRSEVQKMAA